MAKPRECAPVDDAAEMYGATDDGRGRMDAGKQINDNLPASHSCLQAIQAEQAADLAAMLRLQDFSTRLLGTSELPQVLKQVLDATIELQRADFGCVQIYNRVSRKLEIVAHRGFDVTLLDRINNVELEQSAASGRALARRERVIVEDVDVDLLYAPLRDIAAQVGFRAVQSTPLLDRNHELLGVLSTHFRAPHRPSDRDLRLTDLYARQAADVIGFRLTEQSLRESEERFRAIVEQTALGVGQCSFSGRFAFANQRLCELAGRTANEMRQQRFQDITHPDDPPPNDEIFARMARDGRPFEMEKRLVRPDGSTVWVSITASVLRGRDGRPYAATVLVLDLTERNLAREASRESEERLRLMIENAREYAIFSTDLERLVTSWNSGAQRLVGYEEHEILGRSADIIFTAEDRAHGAPEWEARTALTEGRAADERWHLRKDGSRFWGSGVMMAMHDAANNTVGLLKIFRDETQAREVAENLERSRAEVEQALHANKLAREELETASRAKDRFLAVLSHELRTPLTPVVMAVQLLARRTDLPEPARHTLEMIRRNVKVESHLIDDLLDLTRISRGNLEIAAEPMDLHAAIAEAIEICESDVRGKGQTLTVALEASDHQVDGDFNRLQQVVWNLLKNASKFTRHGGNIQLSTHNKNGHVFISISDNGIGIDPTVLPTIFDAFSQGGEWVAREYGGLGLGLAISKATIEAHGGRIKAESEGRGQGATFTIELPLKNM